MGLIEKLREIMKKEYGIKTDSDLLRAIEEFPNVDLGIFAAPIAEDLSHAV